MSYAQLAAQLEQNRARTATVELTHPPDATTLLIN
jgi:hypothetical protein